MNIQDYSTLSLRTLSRQPTFKGDLAHMALGISGEAGEVADIVKKFIAYDKTLDREHLIEELGDVMFYMNGLIHYLGSDWAEVLAKNVAKLEVRYKGGAFNAEQAINRDKEAEKAAMNGV